jgi:hypothetical protein
MRRSWPGQLRSDVSKVPFCWIVRYGTCMQYVLLGRPRRYLADSVLILACLWGVLATGCANVNGQEAIPTQTTVRTSAGPATAVSRGDPFCQTLKARIGADLQVLFHPDEIDAVAASRLVPGLVQLAGSAPPELRGDFRTLTKTARMLSNQGSTPDAATVRKFATTATHVVPAIQQHCAG